jgi:hypothetical protein
MTMKRRLRFENSERRNKRKIRRRIYRSMKDKTAIRWTRKIRNERENEDKGNV